MIAQLIMQKIATFTLTFIRLKTIVYAITKKMLGFLNINEIENILGFFRPKIGLTSPNGLLQ
jgi:hypothetical protein